MSDIELENLHEPADKGSNKFLIGLIAVVVTAIVLKAPDYFAMSIKQDIQTTVDAKLGELDKKLGELRTAAVQQDGTMRTALLQQQLATSEKTATELSKVNELLARIDTRLAAVETSVKRAPGR